MRDIVAKGDNIPLGRQGENLCTRVTLPSIRSGAGTVALYHQRSGDAAPYPLEITEDGDSIYWDVSSVDTAAPGFGCAEMQWLGEQGEILKSRIYRTYVEKALTAPGQTPDPLEDYAAKIAKSAAAAAASEDAAARYSDTAYQAGIAATESAERAAGSASAAADSAASASDAAKDAAAALKALEDGVAAGDFKGDPGTDGKDAPQIDDTAISAANPWSSKHIVDVLCPPMEESGNPVTCYPVAGYPLGVVASWEPTQAGSGVPSPENIRPISGRESVQVERCGENLSTTTGLDNVKWATNYTEIVDILNRLPVGKYTLHIEMTLDSFYNLYTSETEWSTAFRVYINLDDGSSLFKIAGEKITKSAKLPLTRVIRGTFEITTENKGHIAFAYCYACGRDIAADGAPNGALGTGHISNVMLVPGETATAAYTPYTGQTTTLTLPVTAYGGSVNAATGGGQQEWQTLTVNDGTKISMVTGQSYFYTTLNALGGFPNPAPNTASNRMYSNLKYAANIANSPDDNTIALYENGIIRIYVPGIATRDDAAAWVEAHPVQIAYRMATPIPFTATGAQPVTALAGANTLLTDADAVTVTGRADPIKRITDLEDALASVTTND